ncbi:MAG: putative transposase [Euryarchaeota archaeon]|nr:putative transposase [Euryarchaeota archaeon]
MLNKAEEHVFRPEFVLFETWYSSMKNLKEIRKKGWHWLFTGGKKKRVSKENLEE